MTMMTKTPPIAAFPTLPEPAPHNFRSGDMVVIPAAHPLVCVVLGEAAGGLLRLSSAACPEAHLLVSTAEVQYLSVWLRACVAPRTGPK
jgi:hypothetical protein